MGHHENSDKKQQRWHILIKVKFMANEEDENSF